MMMTPDTGPMGSHRVFTRSHEPPHVFRSLSPMMAARTSLATRPGKSSYWSLKKYNWLIVKYLHVLLGSRHLLSVNTRLIFSESEQACLSESKYCEGEARESYHTNTVSTSSLSHYPIAHQS